MTDNETLQSPAELASPPQAGTPASPRRRPPPSNPEAPDELLASLGRRFRGAILRIEFELRTNIARQVFHRDFVYVSQQLHALESSRRVQGLDRQVLKDALSVIQQRTEAVRSHLLHYGAEARALIAAHGHDAADVAFASATRLQATIVSPHARDFLDLLGQADDALSQCEKAWLLGLVEPSAKARCVSECRRALLGFKETVREQRHVVGLHVREVNAARRQAAPASVPTNDASPQTPVPAIGSLGIVESAPAENAGTSTAPRTAPSFEPVAPVAPVEQVEQVAPPRPTPPALSVSSFADLHRLGLGQVLTPPNTDTAEIHDDDASPPAPGATSLANTQSVSGEGS